MDASDSNNQANTSASLGDGFWVALSDGVDPNSSSGHKIGVRAKYNSASGSAKVKMHLRQGNTAITDNSDTLTASYVTYEYTLSSGEADSITDYTDLKYYVKSNSDGDEIEIDYVYFEIPAPSASAEIAWAELCVPPVSSSTESLAEGPLSQSFGEIDAEDGYTIDLSSVPLGTTGKVRLYRTYANGTNAYYVTSLGDGTSPGGTTSYTDDLPDVYLGDPPYNHGDPPLATYQGLIPYYNRLWAIRKNTSFVDYSDLAEPDRDWETK